MYQLTDDVKMVHFPKCYHTKIYQIGGTWKRRRIQLSPKDCHLTEAYLWSCSTAYLLWNCFMLH